MKKILLLVAVLLGAQSYVKSEPDCGDAQQAYEKVVDEWQDCLEKVLSAPGAKSGDEKKCKKLEEAVTAALNIKRKACG